MNLLTSGFYYGGRGYGYGMDPTYFLALIGLILTLIASAKVKSTYGKYAKVRSRQGMTGAMAAERILHSNGIYDVSIQRVSGELTDYYDPTNRVLKLSDSTYGSASIAAVCVAAHECGHALQHQENYRPLALRSILVPAANLGSRTSWPIFVAGLIFSLRSLTMLGILLFSLAVVFQLVTLPVEFNASSRALRILKEQRMLSEEELSGGSKVLRAAALTYVAALASSMLQLLRLIILSRRNDRD